MFTIFESADFSGSFSLESASTTVDSGFSGVVISGFSGVAGSVGVDGSSGVGVAGSTGVTGSSGLSGSGSFFGGVTGLERSSSSV